MNSSLSLHSGFIPGRLNNRALCYQRSSIITYIHVQKSSKSIIIELSSCVVLVCFGQHLNFTQEDSLSVTRNLPFLQFDAFCLILIINQDIGYCKNVRNGYTCHGNVLLDLWIGYLNLEEHSLFCQSFFISHQT